MSNELNERQKLFCKEYVIDFNATRAYKAAGYDSKDDDSASTASSRMLRIDKIQDYLKQLTKERHARLELSADFVLQELMKVASLDIGDLFENGVLKDIDQIKEDARAAIGSIEIKEEYEFDHSEKRKVFTGYTKKVRALDKVKALELLGKHLKLFTESLKVKHSLEDVIVESYGDDDD